MRPAACVGDAVTPAHRFAGEHPDHALGVGLLPAD
jgi:hypothetical protein